MSEQLLRFGQTETQAAKRLIEIALKEDLAQSEDLTCRALINPDDDAEIHVVARESGVVAGLPVGRWCLERRCAAWAKS